MGNLDEQAVENKARWVKISTTVFDHHLFRDDPFCERSAWLWMIAAAAWKKRRIRHHGKMLDLERGQLLGARQFLAETWHWGEKKVRLFLDRLEAEKMIERGQSKGRNANIITICNYDTYQLSAKNEGQSEGQFGAGSGPVEGQTLRRDRNNINTPGERASADDLARQAYIDGQRIKQGSVAKSARAEQRCKGELDGSRGVTFADGKLEVSNGTRTALERDFPGIDLAAVCDRAGPEVAKFSYPSVADAVAVIRKWARISGDEKRPAAQPAFEDFRARRVRDAEEAMEALRRLQS